jgi:uncharacterized protein YjbJ (UPF0337 family)
MDREHIKGAADKAKGTIKDVAGKATGDAKLQTEAKIDKAKGTADNVAGDGKPVARKPPESRRA